MPATELPAGPPPITMTSYVLLFMRSVRPSVQVQKNRSGNDPLAIDHDESARSCCCDARANSFLPTARRQDGTRPKHQRQTSAENKRCRVRRSLTAKPSRESVAASVSVKRPARAAGDLR